MATSNFIEQKDLPLFVSSVFDGYEYEDEEAGRTEYCHGDFWLLREAEKKIKEFSDGLKYYDIELQDGYYCGVQVVLNHKKDTYFRTYEYTEYYTANGWKNARKNEKNYYGYYNDFDLPYSERIKAEQREIAKIIKFCRTVLHDEYDFDEYVVTGRFGNGETLYGLASDWKNQIKNMVA